MNPWILVGWFAAILVMIIITGMAVLFIAAVVKATFKSSSKPAQDNVTPIFRSQ